MIDMRKYLRNKPELLRQLQATDGSAAKRIAAELSSSQENILHICKYCDIFILIHL